VEQAELYVNVNGYDFLSGAMIGGGEATSKHTKTKIGAEINFEDFHIDPELFFETPLAQVSRKGLNKALDNLNKELNEDDEWQARVFDVVQRSGRTYVVINAGEKADVKCGDRPI
jgi:hypothetical protein